MNIRYPIYEGVYRILTESPSLGKTDTVLFPDEVRGGSRIGIETYLHHVHP